MKKMYCYKCDKDVDVISKKEKREYTIHNVSFDVNETVYYCSTCGLELINDTLDNDLKNITNTYLKQYDLSVDKFKQIRESLNLSQELFAKALGWSKNDVVCYENSQKLPSIERLNIYKKIITDQNK